MTFFTSDLHFHHKNILKYTRRHEVFGSVNEMNSRIVEQINDTCGSSGVLYHLGDWSFGNDSETLSVMANFEIAQVRMIDGNHDSSVRMKSLVARANKHIGKEMFQLLGDYAELNLGEKTKAVVCHWPMRVWNRSHHGAWQLHGHCHGSLEPLGRSIDVGYDSPYVTGEPHGIWSLEQIRESMRNREVVVLDHHTPKTME